MKHLIIKICLLILSVSVSPILRKLENSPQETDKSSVGECNDVSRVSTEDLLSNPCKHHFKPSY